MKPYFIRPATREDAVYIASNLRSQDRDEVVALTGLDPRAVIPAYVDEGREVQVGGIVGKEPVIIFGADPIFMEESAAVIWMLSTPVLYDYPVEFVTASRKIWDDYHARYELLTNFTDARNTRHHKWLKWLGAHFIRRVDKFGAQSLPFLEFASYRCA